MLVLTFERNSASVLQMRLCRGAYRGRMSRQRTLRSGGARPSEEDERDKVVVKVSRLSCRQVERVNSDRPKG